MFVPVVITELLATDALTIFANNITPVTRFLVHGVMAEARRFSLSRVVATPVQEDDAQQEKALWILRGS